jgi:hypothetical protein
VQGGSVLLAARRTDEGVVGAADSRSDGQRPVDPGLEPSPRSPATEAAGTFRELRGDRLVFVGLDRPPPRHEVLRRPNKT